MKNDGTQCIRLVEIMPPAGFSMDAILTSLEGFTDTGCDGFTVPSNPVAKARMDSFTCAAELERVTGFAAVPTVTTRDHNRLALQSLLWGMKNRGIETVIAASGDAVGTSVDDRVTPVHDMDVFGLISAASREGFHTGAVLNPGTGESGLEKEMERLARKVDAGARFVITQPIYSRRQAEALSRAAESIPVNIIMGVLPLWSRRHADFLHSRVAGIEIPENVRNEMDREDDLHTVSRSISLRMTAAAKDMFHGFCLMPPFGHYEMALPLLQDVNSQ